MCVCSVVCVCGCVCGCVVFVDGANVDEYGRARLVGKQESQRHNDQRRALACIVRAQVLTDLRLFCLVRNVVPNLISFLSRSRHQHAGRDRGCTIGSVFELPVTLFLANGS